MQSLPDHDLLLHTKQQDGYLAIPEKETGKTLKEVAKLLEEEKIKYAYIRSACRHYKLTRQGWETIKAVKKVLGHF